MIEKDIHRTMQDGSSYNNQLDLNQIEISGNIITNDRWALISSDLIKDIIDVPITGLTDDIQIKLLSIGQVTDQDSFTRCIQIKDIIPFSEYKQLH